MTQQSRRDFLATSVATAATVSLPSLSAAKPPQKSDSQIAFGFSLYGMRSLSVPESLKSVADIGYGCVELVATKGWPCDPAGVSQSQRDAIRARVRDLGLTVPSIMENLRLLGDEKATRSNLDRLKAAAELGHDVSPDRTPVIETVLGGRSSDWDQVKQRMAESLHAWARVGEQSKTVIAIKAHIGGALHTPDGAKWLVDQVDSPWIRLNYDYSHFQLAGFELKSSLETLIDHTVFIHVKDKQGKVGSFQFLLPGDGDIDYPNYWRILKQHAYTGAVMVEVSGQIHGKPGYDPIQAAQRGYDNLKDSLMSSGLWHVG